MVSIADKLLAQVVKLLAGNLLFNRLARLLALAAFFCTRLHVAIIGERLARLGALVATLRTAIGHQTGLRSTPRTNLGAGGTTGRTVLTVQQASQVFFLGNC